MNKFNQIQVVTADQYALTARLFCPDDTPSASVLIVPAMGVQQQYYASFAYWLSRQGFLVATFDYRGIGLSQNGALRGFKSDILTWSSFDCQAMLELLSSGSDETELYWIGHSLGGQIFPFVPNRSVVSKMITIASGTGYWRDAPLQLKRVSWFLWYVVVPVSLTLFGYFPGKRLRMVGDLPHDVMAQWRRWCLHPDYAVGVEGARELYTQVDIPLTSLSFSDDEFMSARNIDDLHAFYRSAPKQMKRISPADVAAQRIGHFGFFRRQFRDTLWKNYLLPELN
ncbi:MAG: alpha/beta hydrolase [Desulfuromonadales bacterium]|nr:alpha/beta hydrolase [Desulfuromonadales bacterium]MBN2792712.1 alpha/beta hydrolase [Desulfuromonadales bacterium]